MYEVPQLSKTYLDKQDILNSSLRQRYNVDLTTYSMRTPSPYKKSFKNPYSNHSHHQLGRAPERAHIEKDDLVDAKPRALKAPHNSQSSNSGVSTTVETYGGRDAKKSVPEESVRTWDSSTVMAHTSTFLNSGYVLPGHEQPNASESFAKSLNMQAAGKSVKQEDHHDRTKTILTLMGTIRLLESKNSELLKARNESDAELQKVPDNMILE